MGEPVETIHLPDTMANWPWPRTLNPYYELVKVESENWIHSFKAFNERSQYAFDKCNFTLLAALAYPWLSKELLRIGSDLMNLFFVIDEYTDIAPKPVVEEIVDVIIDALHNPHKPRPQEEIILGEITRQFWEMSIIVASPSSQRHFLESFTAYLNSVVQQAADRDNNRIRDIATYFENRRENIGSRSSYALLEFELNLPDEVIYHPVIVELTSYITDMLIIDNDIVSYNREQATGNANHNIITIIMHHMKTDLKGAFRWAADYHTTVEQKYLLGLKRVPSWGHEIDYQVQLYLSGLAYWPRGNDSWSFESGRYFGSKGLECQKTRVVPMLQGVNIDKKSCREFTVIHLIDELHTI